MALTVDDRGWMAMLEGEPGQRLKEMGFGTLGELERFIHRLIFIYKVADPRSADALSDSMLLGCLLLHFRLESIPVDEAFAASLQEETT